MTSSIANAGVSMFLIVGFEAYGETDDVNIPQGMFNEFMNMVIQFGLENRPTDLLNDNANG
jgi:hypothetical protein